MDLFDNHKILFRTAFLFFAGLTTLVAIIPALQNQRNFVPLPGAELLSENAVKGKAIFVANGCVACHTQQVRNVDMDKVWGERPGIAADYAGNHRTDFWRNTATLMGSERTGPDLTNIGKRQPSREWNLVHLFNPRSVVEQSIMPAYSWLFEMKDSAGQGDVVVQVPKDFLNGAKGKVIATADALYLVAYLQSLKQTKLPDGSPNPEFLYKKEIQAADHGASRSAAAEGVALYAANCQSCHQPNGEGVKGAFPPLKGSSVVLNENPEKMISIIMNGYSARVQEGFAVMPAVGANNSLSPEAITAIMNHEKSSWGNTGKPVTVEEVKRVVDFLKLTSKDK